MPAALPAFDTLLDLARHDPEALERLRQRLCEQVIERAADSSRERLRGLVWRLDQERRRARTPLAACLRLHNLMLDSLQRLDAAFNDDQPSPPRPPAKVLPFRH